MHNQTEKSTGEICTTIALGKLLDYITIIRIILYDLIITGQL